MAKKEVISKKSIDSIYSQIKEIIESAKSSAYKAVNFAKVQSYWLIGKTIVDQEQRGKTRAKYGTELIKKLSSRLQNEYGEGYNATNLKYSRQFYIAFPISHAASDKLPSVKMKNCF